MSIGRYYGPLLLCVFLLQLSSCRGLRCTDEENQEVDWYVNYKLPKLEAGHPKGSLVSEGKAYAYISSRQPGGWKLSPNGVTSQESMLAKTLKAVYDPKKNSSYLFYNDEPPAGYNGTSKGHLKGVVAFDGKSGFWLVHSIPKAFSPTGYAYPDNALSYGQSVLCVTLTVHSLDEICNQLLHTRPFIYASRLTDPVASFLSDPAKTLFGRAPSFNRRPPYHRTTTLCTEQKKAFTSFVKDGRFNGDIYSALLAPTLRTSLSAETWRRGSGTYLPPACEGPYDVTDVASVRMTLGNGDFIFKSTDDHSKWAVTTHGDDGWICVGDMNRMASQGRRGGGSLCFQSTPVVKAYQSLVYSSDQCPDLQSVTYRLQ
ncbi:hypothetical protein JTE90_016301 [Oedothorax gibbosus]|uniref:Uncharacterized protein n=1 Tax=Oedothorax gibbosus TaxID=931172 RepID=A0AAV6U807_9ARAC|nr:hypothetical protein JTE90_016301 [Oedothorax gibbosus]